VFPLVASESSQLDRPISDIGVDWRIILKWVIKKNKTGYGLNLSGPV
jgi:hypothetical protein